MKKILFIVLAIAIVNAGSAQSVGIGTSNPNSNAALDISSFNKGLLVPRIAKTVRLGMTNVPKGLLLYDSTAAAFYFHDGVRWRIVGENNPDSLLIDRINSPEVTENISDYFQSNSASGIMYDNGGPTGNYTNNRNDFYQVAPNDSTIGYKVIVEEATITDPNDSLQIYINENFDQKIKFPGTAIGTYYFIGTSALQFSLRSNTSVTSAGFKLRWSRLTVSEQASDPAPAYGWYYNNRRNSVRGGINNMYNSWPGNNLGWTSFGWGDNVTATGDKSFSLGKNTTASGELSFAFGNGAKALGSLSMSLGTGTEAKAYGCYALGAYNDPIASSSPTFWQPEDPLLLIGNGSGSNILNRKNLLTILKNGNIGLSTNTPNTKLHIVGGTDASLAANSGYFTIGDVNSTNIVFDNNEIIARNNAANSTLFLQNSGGAFEIGGTAAKPGGGSWSATSDARLKQNVMPYQDGLQQLMKINPVYYKYNQLSGYDSNKQYIGVLAQDLKPIAPYMVNAFNKNGTEYYSVDNSAMTYMLINSVKEQQAQIAAQEKQIAVQQQQISDLANALKALMKK